MGNRLAGFGRALYNPKRKELLGRDGAGWGKLGVFYFFFYIGLAGFFCAMLALFMAMTPRDRPRFYSAESCMKTRSNPLAPGLGFRPQPEVDKNLIVVDKDVRMDYNNPYVRNLDKYLQVYYGKAKTNQQRKDDNQNVDNRRGNEPEVKTFSMNDVGDCRNNTLYGFSSGRPCVLVKMNKIVDFMPEPGSTDDEEKTYREACEHRPDAIAVHCYGEYPADADNIGPVTYYSENGRSNKCGALMTSRFPYQGKRDRKDYYQAPYVWVQFNKATPNVLINVICRIYGSNIDFEKKAGRALTRFQLYIKDLPIRDL